MTTWTPAAREELERQLERVRRRLDVDAVAGDDAGGAVLIDAGEVVDDLRRHVDEEFGKQRVSVVTVEDVRRVLAQIGVSSGDGSQSGIAGTEPRRSSDQQSLPAGRSEVPKTPAMPGAPGGRTYLRPQPTFLGTAFTVLLGVVSPLLAIGIELATRTCASEIFDPLPTPWHVLLALTVPLNNLLMLALSEETVARHYRKLGWLNAVAVGAGLFYTAVFLPLLPVSVVAIVALGIGFLPLAPLTGLVNVLRSRSRFADAAYGTGVYCPRPRPRLRWGLALVGMLMAVLHAPGAVTHVALMDATSSDEGARGRGLWLLRHLGSNDAMLRACYAGRGSMGDPVRAAMTLFGEVDPEAAREAYYRATGTPFNAYPPPTGTFRGQGRAWEAEWEWDADQGGDAVAGQVRGLSLAESRLDGIVDADGANAYEEWTLVFKNDSSGPNEARAQVLLPHGGVVSRLTLWVNGQPCEAAFSGREQVKQAYKSVAIRQRRDPVLVTTAGPDRVLVQCFPVPAKGTMKVRLGITAPMRVSRADRATVGLPLILERNFAVKDPLRHSVWLEGTTALSDPSGLLRAERPKETVYALRGDLSDAQLSGFAPAIAAARDPRVATSWATAPVHLKDGEQGVFVQRLVPAVERPPGHLVLVVDTSRTMTAAVKSVAEALGGLPAGVRLDVVLADDAVTRLTPQTVTTSGEAIKPVADALRDVNCVGGPDGAPALSKAWDLAADVPDGMVLWVHGPQPVQLAGVEGLLQRYERRPDGPRLVMTQAAVGPNRICEALDVPGPFATLPREGALGDDLGRLFHGWAAGAQTLSVVRERATTRPTGDGVKQTSPHLARLWAFEQVRDRAKSGRVAAGRTKAAEALKLATAYQLVTPVSGAVVLETAAQYAANGLTPVDAATVPTVPEPETVALLAVAAMVVIAAIWKRRRTPRAA